MCAVLLPPGGNTTIVNKYININVKIYLAKFYDEGGVKMLV
jgi:hypothetical protein